MSRYLVFSVFQMLLLVQIVIVIVASQADEQWHSRNAKRYHKWCSNKIPMGGFCGHQRDKCCGYMTCQMYDIALDAWYVCPEKSPNYQCVCAPEGGLELRKPKTRLTTWKPCAGKIAQGEYCGRRQTKCCSDMKCLRYSGKPCNKYSSNWDCICMNGNMVLFK